MGVDYPISSVREFWRRDIPSRKCPESHPRSSFYECNPEKVINLEMKLNMDLFLHLEMQSQYYLEFPGPRRKDASRLNKTIWDYQGRIGQGISPESAF